MDRLTELFIRDSKKYLAQAVNSLINIEKKEDVESNIETAFRAVHSIKTESSYLQMTETKNLSHEIENTLESFRNGEIVPDKDSCGRIISELDNLSIVIRRELEIQNERKPGNEAKTDEAGNSSEINKKTLSINPDTEIPSDSEETESILDIENEEEYYILEYNIEDGPEEAVNTSASLPDKPVSGTGLSAENTDKGVFSLNEKSSDMIQEKEAAHDEFSVISGSVSASGLADSSAKVLPVKKRGYT